MQKTVLIPARYASTRLPGKMLKPLGSKPLIVRTYEAVCNTQLFNEVAVVCDHQEIYDAVVRHGGKAIMSLTEHECGTDRIAEAAHHFQNSDIIVNVQGDEPFTEKESLELLLKVFESDDGKSISVASLMHPLYNMQEIENPNNVKVVVDKNDYALLFSRSVIPYPRNFQEDFVYHKHIGIYAFRTAALQEFATLPKGKMEAIEQLENLRLIENNIPIKMVRTRHIPIGIDTEEDLIEAQERFKD